MKDIKFFPRPTLPSVSLPEKRGGKLILQTRLELPSKEAKENSIAERASLCYIATSKKAIWDSTGILQLTRCGGRRERGGQISLRKKAGRCLLLFLRFFLLFSDPRKRDVMVPFGPSFFLSLSLSLSFYLSHTHARSKRIGKCSGQTRGWQVTLLTRKYRVLRTWCSVLER